MPTAPTVNLTGVDVTLVAPRPIAALAMILTENDLKQMGQAAAWVKSAGALRACWPEDVAWPARPRPLPCSVGLRVEEWGAGIFDGLISAGVSPAKLLDVGGVAREWCAACLPTEPEVAAAEDFSEAPED